MERSWEAKNKYAVLNKPQIYFANVKLQPEIEWLADFGRRKENAICVEMTMMIWKLCGLLLAMNSEKVHDCSSLAQMRTKILQKDTNLKIKRIRAILNFLRIRENMRIEEEKQKLRVYHGVYTVTKAKLLIWRSYQFFDRCGHSSLY